MKKVKANIYSFIIALWKLNPLKLQTRNILLAVNLPLDKFIADLRYRGVFYVKNGSSGFNLNNPAYTTIENEIFWRGVDMGWEHISVDLWKKLCPEATVIFDIGANTGIYALIASTTNPRAMVYAFEPSKNTFPLLKKNKEINSLNNFNINEIAVSNYNGTATFYDYKDTSNYTASLNNDFHTRAKEETTIAYEVKVSTVDSFIKENNIHAVDLLKIDVELHEYEVLEGMRQTLTTFKPTLIIEVLNETVGKRVQEILSNIDYIYFNIREKEGIVQVKNLTGGDNDNHNYLVCNKVVAQKLGLI